MNLKTAIAIAVAAAFAAPLAAQASADADKIIVAQQSGSTMQPKDSNPAAPKIEETNFAASLNVNLAQSTKLPSGVYYRDLVVGTGKTVELGQKLLVYYTGALANGTVFDSTQPPAARSRSCTRSRARWRRSS